MDSRVKTGDKVWFLMILPLCVVYGLLLYVVPVGAAQLVLEADSVKVGSQVAFEGDLEGCSFKSSNDQVAYISKTGVVTGKRKAA